VTADLAECLSTELMNFFSSSLMVVLLWLSQNGSLVEVVESAAKESDGARLQAASAQAIEQAGRFSDDEARRITEALASRGLAEQAIRFWGKRQETQPGALAPYLVQGQLLQRLGKLEEANRLYQSAIAQGLSDPELLFSKARVVIGLAQSGRAARPEIEEACVLLDKALDKAPDPSEIHNLRGIALAHLGRDRESGASYERASSLAPSRFDYVFNLSFHYQRQKNHPQAIAVLERYSAGHPGSIEVRERLLWFYVQARRFHPSAERIVQELIALDPQRLQTRLLAANFYRDQGDLSKARSHSDSAVRIDPRNAVAHFARGAVLIQENQVQQALAEFEESFRLDSHYAPAALEIGKIRLRLGDLQQARRALESALALDPALSEVHFQLGTLFRKQGDASRARAEFELYEASSLKLGERR